MLQCKLISNSSLLFLISVIILAMEVSESSTDNSERITTCEKRHPVMYVPGFGGSQLEANVEIFSFTPFSITIDLWLNLNNLFDLTIKLFGKSWIDRMKLVYDPNSHTSSSPPGVNTKVLGWGEADTVHWVVRKELGDMVYGIKQFLEGQNNISISSKPWFLTIPEVNEVFEWFTQNINQIVYFRDITEALISLGFTPNTSLSCGPYDFRKAANEQQEYFKNLRSLVEEMYHMNQDTPVVLLSHSMGGPMTLHFLYNQDIEWKKKFIKSFISLSAPWGGTMKSLKSYVEGNNLDIRFFSAETIKQVLVTFPSLAWLVPSSAFWREDEVLVSINTTDYTLTDIKKFFYDIHEPQAWEHYKDVLNYTNHQVPPDVEVHCLYGSDVNETLERLHYDESGQANYVYSTDGDGTVNLRSLEGCQRWIGRQEEKVYHYKYSGVKHNDILRNEDVINYIKRVACSME